MRLRVWSKCCERGTISHTWRSNDLEDISVLSGRLRALTAISSGHVSKVFLSAVAAS